MQMIRGLQYQGPAAIELHADLFASAWDSVGASHCPASFTTDIDRGVAEWLEGPRSFADEHLHRIHRAAAPSEPPHTYRTGPTAMALEIVGGRRVFSDYIVYECPEAEDVEALMAHVYRTVEPLPIPVGNALLHVNIHAIHPYKGGNSRTITALTLGRSIADAHPNIAPYMLDAAFERWDGMFSGYEQQLLAALGSTWDPGRDLTNWVAWWVEAETKLHVVSALLAAEGAPIAPETFCLWSRLSLRQRS
jgi:hypothetical protein